MSYLHLSRTRTRERSPSPPYRPLIRRDTKRSRIITLSDDEDAGHDDYPYSAHHRPSKSSRALTIRNQPSQLERYNIWSDRHKSEDRTSDSEYEREKLRIYKRSSRHHSDDDDCPKPDAEERAFRLKIAAKFSHASLSPSPRHHQHHQHAEAHHWPGEVLRRKEKWVDEGWETRERSRSRSRSRENRRDSFWGEDGIWGKDEVKESEDEKWSRYRKIKRTKTEEWTPLRGWRRV
ncbi:hypothetical protein EK21DRAFT_63454 [Setomelanomma holmii]|uniref:Uncharacterized protein n=1 Tax=Setomelanomma holmii TaxID=210430 RepID=A0A9P4HBX0_9PLEO|nr:hypothetical protein EK21DRAFT_63454 [Setomelanomma holmii]